jgi:16S rRNA G966 N2-methylase RsmD
MDRVVAASTHPWAYKLHKYWARKPHNVLGQLVEALTPSNGLVVDPFCGSGVLLREAAVRGRRSLGFDVNPIAVLLSRVTLDPPTPAAFQAEIAPVLEKAREAAASLYGYTAQGPAVRYVTHEILVSCPGCGVLVGATEVERVGRSYMCRDCGKRLNLNARAMIGTRAVAVAYEGERQENTAADVLADQTQLSTTSLDVEARIADAPLIENARTLAHPGMTVSDLFTTRNWSLVCYCRCLIGEIGDERLRDAAILLLTASVAQCSRLIAHRANLTGGGPAWTVPGFWVPPLHLETNPAIHLAARAKKFAAGLRELAESPASGRGTVKMVDGVAGLREVVQKTGEVDLVFLDPPYGDSVPYLEFSVMWNTVLGQNPDVATDIAVSDRRQSPSRWDEYATELKEVASAASDAVGDRGTVLITFNNNDLRAWTALLSGLHAADLRCDAVWYQIPAVVPSKAQFSPRGSYISDVYAIFRRGLTAERGTTEDVRHALGLCAAARGGRVPISVARRTLVIEWMEHNLPADGLLDAQAILEDLFDQQGDVMIWRGDLPASDVSLQRIVSDAVSRRISTSGYPWVRLYEEVANAMVGSGVPDPWEIREAWGGVSIRAGMCVLPTDDDQLSFFAPS